MTHMGADAHLHLLFEHEGQTHTAHLEHAGLAEGARLFLPKPDLAE